MNNDPFISKIHDPHINPGQNPPKVPTPKPATIFDVFPLINRWGIGLDSFFDELNTVASVAKSSTYPPTNLTKYGEDKWEIEMAVAGFKRDQLEISVKERTLTVKSLPKKSTKDSFGKVIHQGIAERDFTQTFALSEYVEVVSAELEDGLLLIKLELQIPEEKKPKVIDIK